MPELPALYAKDLLERMQGEESGVPLEVMSEVLAAVRVFVPQSGPIPSDAVAIDDVPVVVYDGKAPIERVGYVHEGQQWRVAYTARWKLAAQAEVFGYDMTHAVEMSGIEYMRAISGDNSTWITETTDLMVEASSMSQCIIEYERRVEADRRVKALLDSGRPSRKLTKAFVRSVKDMKLRVAHGEAGAAPIFVHLNGEPLPVLPVFTDTESFRRFESAYGGRELYFSTVPALGILEEATNTYAGAIINPVLEDAVVIPGPGEPAPTVGATGAIIDNRTLAIAIEACTRGI